MSIPSIGTLANAATSVISLITNFLPMIGVSEKTTETIGKVVTTLNDISPLLIDQVEVTYAGVKNIINALGANPATTAEQMEQLKELDRRVDAAWNEIEAQLDPDAPDNK